MTTTTTTAATSDAAVTSLCNTVMRGVAAMFRGKLPVDAGIACEIMREEIKAFVSGATPEYDAARRAVADGSMNSGYAVGLVIANCGFRIQQAGCRK